MRKICLVYGGDSLENEISILTALKVKDELEKFSYPYEMVYMGHNGDFYTGKGLLHKNNYHNKTNFKSGMFCLLLAFVSIIISILGGIYSKTDINYIEYKVTINDSVSMNEFLDKYEILEQEGKIYTVKVRE